MLVVFWMVSSAPGVAAEEQKARVRVERYQIAVAFQPEKGFLQARAAVTLRADQVVEAVEVELNPHLKVLEVTDAQGRRLEFSRSGRLGSPKLSVRLAEGFSAGRGGPPPALNADEGCPPSSPAQEATEGACMTLTFIYEGALPQKSLDYVTKDGILLRDESRWYPAVDLAAFTQNDLTVTVPAGWYAVSSGSLVEHRRAKAADAFRWKTERPISSRSLAAVSQPEGDCMRFPRGAGGALEKANHEIAVCPAPRGQDIRGQTALGERAGDLVAKYDELLGPYAHPGLTVVRGFPGQRGAIGYSAPGLLVVSEDVLKYFDYPGYAPEFLPHEIAHQWFPIEVTIARQEDGWLAESLAEYLAWRYLQEKDPEQARRMVARALRDALAPEPLRPLALGLRLFALESWKVTRATLYQRGLLVWRTLETVIDRERVDRALRESYRRYAGRAASIADFRKICEEISGRDLGWFFDYFIQGTRVPEIEIRRAPPTAPGELAGEIVLKNVPPEFQVRVEMRLETMGGVLEHSVATRGEVTPFTVTSRDPVTRFTLDPDLRILRWTEAARRNRSQRALLARLGELETAGEFLRAVGICQKALALDPEDLASNEQQVRFELARLRYRMKQYAGAFQEFARVLELRSLNPTDADFNRAWARVYRARIEKLRGNRAAARAEARSGLAPNSPALETQVTLPEAPGRATTAAAELRTLAQ